MAETTTASMMTQPTPPESYKSQTYSNKGLPFFIFYFFLEEGGKVWIFPVYIGIQCFTNTAVKPQLVQWSYKLE